jgi:acetyl-CoA C-acetyltransferase
MTGVHVVGVGSTPFGERWETSFRELITEAGLDAVQDAGIEGPDIDSMFVGSMSAGRFVGQEHVGALVADEAGLATQHIPSTRIEAADASGGAALRQGVQAVASGASDLVVVGGVEKMTDAPETEQSNTFAAASDQEWEAFFGATVPSLYALMARRHMEEFGTTEEQLAEVSAKNHGHGAKNPEAAYPFPIDASSVLESTPVAEPLNLFDCAAPVDGAAALVLASEETARELGAPPVEVAASAQASDSLALHSRDSLTEIASTREAARRAYERAGTQADDVDVAEVHDSFTIGEVLAIEDLGLFEKGRGQYGAEKGSTSLGGRIPVNTSGGLKARGHAVGATGVAQAAEIVTQLRGEADERQVDDAEVGLTQNVGGTGATAAVHLFQRGDAP